MRRLFSAVVMTAGAGLGLFMAASPAVAADTYAVDGAHSSISFKIEHMGISRVHGRFNKFEGSFAIDKADPAKSSFSLTIKTDSIDTANEGRDKHLRQPGFLRCEAIRRHQLQEHERQGRQGWLRSRRGLHDARQDEENQVRFARGQGNRHAR